MIQAMRGAPARSSIPGTGWSRWQCQPACSARSGRASATTPALGPALLPGHGAWASAAGAQLPLSQTLTAGRADRAGAGVVQPAGRPLDHARNRQAMPTWRSGTCRPSSGSPRWTATAGSPRAGWRSSPARQASPRTNSNCGSGCCAPHSKSGRSMPKIEPGRAGARRLLPRRERLSSAVAGQRAMAGRVLARRRLPGELDSGGQPGRARRPDAGAGLHHHAAGLRGARALARRRAHDELVPRAAAGQAEPLRSWPLPEAAARADGGAQTTAVRSAAAARAVPADPVGSAARRLRPLAAAPVGSARHAAAGDRNPVPSLGGLAACGGGNPAPRRRAASGPALQRAGEQCLGRERPAGSRAAARCWRAIRTCRRRCPRSGSRSALTAPGLAVSGVSVPGLPAILIGHNAHIAWSLTDTQSQAALFYAEQTSAARPREYFWDGQWRQMQVLHYTIPVRGARGQADLRAADGARAGADAGRPDGRGRLDGRARLPG